AWTRSRGEDVVPLIGARRRDQLKEALGALDISLTATDLARIAQAVPAEAVAGTRYLPAGLAPFGSEDAGERGPGCGRPVGPAKAGARATGPGPRVPPARTFSRSSTRYARE